MKLNSQTLENSRGKMLIWITPEGPATEFSHSELGELKEALQKIAGAGSYSTERCWMLLAEGNTTDDVEMTLKKLRQTKVSD